MDKTDHRRDTGRPDQRATTSAILIAHGSRTRAANQDFERLTELVRHRGQYAVVESAYLELVEPTIEQAADRCVAAGAMRVLLLPYFLFAGIHATDDLKRIRLELSRRYPDVAFVLCEPLGLHPALIDIVLERLADGDTAH